ncbi:hypothetical protein [Streptomyces sp. NPDC002156]
MGNTRAWPVLRTTDLDEALNLAEKLLSVASWYDPSGCYLDAWAHSDDEVRRLTEALPDVQVSWYGKGNVGLPALLSVGADSIAQARESLGIWAGISRGYVLWHNMTWPAVPQLGLLNEEYKYAELQVAANSHTIHCEEWSAEHTVFVHARPGDDERPAWLAAQVGSRVVGPAEFGW